MKAKIWIKLCVEVEVAGSDELECRQAAVARIDDISPEAMSDALDRAKNIGHSYPGDVTEIVEVY